MTTEQIEREAEKRLRAIGKADPPDDPFCIDGDDLTKMDGDMLHSYCELLRMAQAFVELAELPRDLRARMFHLLGRRPYLYERNLGRWPDGRFYLVDRDYQPWEGFDMSHEELDALGVTAWHETKWRQVGFIEGCFAVTDDEFASAKDPQGLRLLAALLRRMARHVRHRAAGAAA